MNEISCSPSQKLFVFETVQELIDHTVANFVKTVNLRKKLCIALSGGSTPKAYFEALTQSREAKNLDWSKLYFFWSDERAVPADHPESNFKMAMQFFSQKPFSNAHFFRMHAENDDKENAAKQYEELIKKECPNLAFDIIYLGVGEDGHTASLFPGSWQITDKLIASCYVPSKNIWRMTFTLPLINRAEQIIILATGTTKAKILKEVLIDHNPELPVGHVGSKKSPAQFFCDQQAAELCVS